MIFSSSILNINQKQAALVAYALTTSTSQIYATV